MRDAFPPWVFALVLAVLAPFLAKTLAIFFERRSRARSQRLLVNFHAPGPPSE